MTEFNRRDALKVGAGAVAGAAIVANAGEAQAQASTLLRDPEGDDHRAQLRHETPGVD